MSARSSIIKCSWLMRERHDLSWHEGLLTFIRATPSPADRANAYRIPSHTGVTAITICRFHGRKTKRLARVPSLWSICTQLAAARLQHIAVAVWSIKRSLNIELLKEQADLASAGRRRSAQVKNSGLFPSAPQEAACRRGIDARYSKYDLRPKLKRIAQLPSERHWRRRLRKKQPLALILPSAEDL
jgi:hypothetical protein